jgi:hypothetical protein
LQLFKVASDYRHISERVELHSLKLVQVGEQKAGTAIRPTYHTRRANRNFPKSTCSLVSTLP